MKSKNASTEDNITYFLILFYSKENEESLKMDNYPFFSSECILSEIHKEETLSLAVKPNSDKGAPSIKSEIKKLGSKKFLHIQVFRLKHKPVSEISLKFKCKRKEYNVSFSRERAPKTLFVFSSSLKTKEDEISTRSQVKQDVLDNKEKMEYFKRAIENEINENEGSNLYEDLYYSCIKAFEKEPKFEFLISLFIEIYAMTEICKNF